MKLALRGGEKLIEENLYQWPRWDKAEEDGLLRVLHSNKWGSIHGDEVSSFEREFCHFQHAEHGIAINSGTTALEVALKACGLQAGEEVIIPAYTFIATATAVLMNGGIPVMVDIEPDTYNIDPKHIEQAITENTRAIMPVHFAGRPADLDAIQQIANKNDLVVIEDAAQAWGSEWRGRGVGATSQMGCFSFQSSKNITAAEGGIVLTDNEEFARMVRSYHNCGRTEDGVWYAHYHLGGNCRMTEFQAAILRAQLARYPEHLKIRQENAAFLHEKLADVPGISLMKKDERITSTSQHLFIFRYDKNAFDNVSKAEFINALQAEGVPCSGGYSLPLYEQPIFKNSSFGPFTSMLKNKMQFENMHLPETHKACYEEAIWLPQAVLLNPIEKIQKIVDAITKVVENRVELI